MGPAMVDDVTSFEEPIYWNGVFRIWEKWNSSDFVKKNPNMLSRKMDHHRSADGIGSIFPGWCLSAFVLELFKIYIITAELTQKE